MSQPDPEGLLSIAEAVSDGSEVDWDRVRSGSPGRAATVERLRQIAEVSSVLVGGGRAERDVMFRWGPLEVLAKIGEGSYGEVYRARDAVLGREVALKLRRRGPSDAEFSNRAFVDEARRLARVDHPNVVRVFGADVHDGRVGLWTELLEGKDLTGVLEAGGPLAPTEAVGVAIEMCRALAAVHSAGIVHGDLKPDNVVKARDGRWVLTDFGAGTELARDGRAPQARSGTPLAMAPELLDGKPPTERADLYSLGVLLYRLLTGRHPIEARDLAELRRRHRNGEATPILDLRPGLPPALVEVIETALAADPDARFPSAGVMERRLRGVLAGRAPRRGRVSGAPAWARVWVAAAVGGVLALALVALWPWARGSGDSRAGERTVEGEPPRLEGPESSAADDRAGAGPAAAAPAPSETGAVGVAVGESADAPRSEDAVAAAEDGAEAGTSAGSGLPLGLTLRRSTAAGAETLVAGSVIQPGDQLFLEVRPQRPVHLYVLNQDLAGELFVLFPLDGIPPANPLAPGATYRLPGSRDGVELDWQVTSAGGTETFLFVASERHLSDLEERVSALEAAALGGAAPDGPTLRGVGGLAASRAGSAGDRLSALSAWIETLREQGEPVWVERIDLSNPAP